MSKGRKRKGRSKSRRLALKIAVAVTALASVWACVSVWFIHHPRAWLDACAEAHPRLTAPLFGLGNPLGDLTDALGLTGHDAVYEYDEEAPSGSVTFAGEPRRTGLPAPDDIVVLDRGEFRIGWSAKLRHPVWCAYHVPAEARFEVGKRPNFLKDSAAPGCPAAGAYDKSGYDRGHLAPNYAIATRFGEEAQKLTFRMSNVAPQSPELNRAVWRNVEHRIADLWTARWGEIWVIVGCIDDGGRETLSGTDVNVPARFYQVVVAQDGLDIRAFAVVYGQSVPWRAWPTAGLVSIDELERMTGLDFLPDLPSFIQDPLESEVPTRLWPIRKRDVFKLISLRFR